jgi:hypothetical protein
MKKISLLLKNAEFDAHFEFERKVTKELMQKKLSTKK